LIIFRDIANIQPQKEAAASIRYSVSVSNISITILEERAKYSRLSTPIG
jgi:hypothetical protein